MSLSAAAITEERVLQAAKTLLKEWLTSWFDGASHALGTVTPNPTFPALTGTGQVQFDQSAETQPLDGLSARIVVHRGRERTHWFTASESTDSWLVSADVLVDFYVRCKDAKGMPESNRRVNEAADLLKAILSNPVARVTLAEKGVTHARAQLPQTLVSEHYAVRLVVCSAQLQYQVNF